MHPRTQELLDFLDSHRAALRTAIVTVPRGLCDRRPAQGRWSVAEVLEHLSLVEARVVRLFTERLAAAREAGLGAERERAPIPPTIDTSLALDRNRRLEASDAARPRGQMDTTAALALLRSTREATIEAITAADGLALGEVSAPHPVLGMLDLNNWIIFIGLHEARHTQQILENGRVFEEAEEQKRRARAERRLRE